MNSWIEENIKMDELQLKLLKQSIAGEIRKGLEGSVTPFSIRERTERLNRCANILDRAQISLEFWLEEAEKEKQKAVETKREETTD